MSEEATPQKSFPIPSDRVEELIQLIKETSTAPLFSLAIDEARTPALTDTKLGGLPYWPCDLAYPTTPKGLKLMLLAQLDLTDFGGCEKLPDHGLLQFFIDSDDDCSGMDFDEGTNQDGFRVVWHETVDPSVTADDVRAIGMPTSFDPWDDALGNPLRGEYALDVSTGTNWANPSYDGFDEIFLACARTLLGDEALAGQEDWYDCLSRPDSDKVFEQLGIKGPLHQVFGYPFFTQTDPRYLDKYKDLDTVLLQVDSDGTKDGDRVLWGDVGIGAFFINGEALRRGDFSRVLFNWDCY